jgi:hypothetical protein
MDKKVYTDYEQFKKSAVDGKLYKYHQTVLLPQYNRVERAKETAAECERKIAQHNVQLQTLQWALEDANRELASEENKLADQLAAFEQ